LTQQKTAKSRKPVRWKYKSFLCWTADIYPTTPLSIDVMQTFSGNTDVNVINIVIKVFKCYGILLIVTVFKWYTNTGSAAVGIWILSKVISYLVFLYHQ